MPACSKYVASVTMLDSEWNVQTPQNWLRLQIPYDPRASPQNPQMKIFLDHLRFSWQHNCRHNNQQPPYYLFKIHNIPLNVTEIEKVYGLSYQFHANSLGAEYTFSVATPSTDAVPIVWNYTATALPAPTHLNVTRNSNGTFTLEWDAIKLHNIS